MAGKTPNDLAKADIWWIAESDDISEPEFLATLLPAFKNPQVRLAYVNSHVIDEKGAIVGDYLNSDYLTTLSSTRWNTSYRIPAQQEINEARQQQEGLYVPISEADVDPSTLSAKIIAFYLPQFHPIPENDQWWGKGFV